MRMAMRLLGMLVLVAAGMPAAAAPQSADERSWKDCEQRADVDRRIVGCTQIVADPGEKPGDRAVAYNNRGNAHGSRGDYARAIADYSEAAKLDPNYVWAYANRGRAYLFTGAVIKARADFEQATKLESESAYLAIWRDIADRRSHGPSGLGEALGQLDMDKWPAPIVRLYLGAIAPSEVFVAARKIGQVCEANFYSGELALAQDDKAEAERLFRAAVVACPAGLIESQGARAELRALSAKE